VGDQTKFGNMTEAEQTIGQSQWVMGSWVKWVNKCEWVWDVTSSVT